MLTLTVSKSSVPLCCRDPDRLPTQTILTKACYRTFLEDFNFSNPGNEEGLIPKVQDSAPRNSPVAKFAGIPLHSKHNIREYLGVKASMLAEWP